MADNQTRAREQARSRQVKASRAGVKIKGAGKIRSKELCPFTMRLAAMLDAGLPLVQTLDALVEQTEHEGFQEIITDIRERIESGDSFAEALVRYQALFGDLYISMIRAGELGGSLSDVTRRLGSYMESSAALKRRVVSAMTYPVMVLGLSVILAIAMIMFIVPKFADMYKDFDAKLPAATEFLINLSNALKSNFLIFAGGVAALCYAIRQFKRSDVGGYLWDRNILQVPIAGQLIYKISIARLSRTFASLIRSGVSILQSFEIASQSAGNKYVCRALIDAQRDVESGATIASALKDTKAFPPMLTHMVSAGERTGNVDGMLEKVADFYEEEVASTLESLASMIEPLLMAFLGVMIGGIAVCMFMPIFKLGQVVTGG